MAWYILIVANRWSACTSLACWCTVRSWHSTVGLCRNLSWKSESSSCSTVHLCRHAFPRQRPVILSIHTFVFDRWHWKLRAATLCKAGWWGNCKKHNSLTRLLAMFSTSPLIAAESSQSAMGLDLSFEPDTTFFSAGPSIDNIIFHHFALSWPAGLLPPFFLIYLPWSARRRRYGYLCKIFSAEPRKKDELVGGCLNFTYLRPKGPITLLARNSLGLWKIGCPGLPCSSFNGTTELCLLYRRASGFTVRAQWLSPPRNKLKRKKKHMKLDRPPGILSWSASLFPQPCFSVKRRIHVIHQFWNPPTTRRKFLWPRRLESTGNSMLAREYSNEGGCHLKW